MTDNKLRNYLEWLITPQDDKEQCLFKSENLVDDYIGLKQRIPLLNRMQLIEEINIQLAPYGLEINYA
jgi:hypothetical protein